MNYYKILFSLLFCFNFLVAQPSEIKKHKILKGETLVSICQDYKVTAYSLLVMNPDLQRGVEVNSIILIPKPFKSQLILSKKHKVLDNETKYGIAKMHNISIEELEKMNPILKTEELRIDQILELEYAKQPQKDYIQKKPNEPKNLIYHTILPQETKYSVAKKYNLSIAELENQNPAIVDNFPIGFQLRLALNVNAPINTQISAVATKQTKPNVNFEKPIIKLETIGSKKSVSLNKSISKSDRKELVLFLPFNASKIENDTINSLSERFKKDKFLNLTLDFYSGAMMAIDSAKVLNLNLNIRIFDSEETKNSSSAVSIINNSNFENTDVVIGPFYQANVEKVAEVLSDKKTKVISPLSKETGNFLPNLIQSMPTLDATKNALFDYIRSKNGNCIAVIDPKKQSIKNYLEAFQKDIHFVNVNEKGGFVGDSIKKFFVKDKTNFVVMESERTGIIFTTTTTMLNAMKDYQVQLAILEPNETLDFEEISISRLSKLKMLYPSITNEAESDAGKKFERAYKKKNKIFPNQYAVRGFDLVFDTMMRLSQEQSFDETLVNTSTMQVENKFEYVANSSGGFSNSGVSILYYDTDLTIKQAP